MIKNKKCNNNFEYRFDNPQFVVIEEGRADKHFFSHIYDPTNLTFMFLIEKFIIS